MRKKKRGEKREKRSGGSIRWKEMKLSSKLSVICAIVLLVCMMTSNVISIARVSSKLDGAVDAQLNKLCDENTLKIKSVLADCASISEAITFELTDMYNRQSAGTAEEAAYTSSVCGEPLTREQRGAETVILNSIWAALNGNDTLEGVGVFFEPNAFSPSIRNYGPYGVKGDISTRRIENFTYDRYRDREYYTGAKGGEMAFMDAYIDTNGTLMYSVGYPIMYKGAFKGVVLLDIRSDLFSMLDETDETYPSMYIDLIRENHNIIYSTRTDTIAKNLRDLVTSASYNDLANNMKSGARFSVTTKEDDGKYVRYAASGKVGAETWYVMTSLLKSEYTAAADKIFFTTMLLSAATIIITILLIRVILGKMLKPLAEIETVANSMANGNLQVDITHESKDEIGSVAASMGVMTRRTRRVIQDLSEILGQLANGNFQVQMTSKEIYVGDFRPLIVAVEGIVDKLNESLINIRTASEQVNIGAEQVASASQGLSQGATEQASTAQELFATMEEISNETKRTAEKAGKANEIADIMGSEVVKSNGKMEEMSEAMRDITDKSGEIEKIIKTIDDIAFQTNILALNAAVEAARAGSAGKGFAVVADEVRNLAQKSAEAAKNTAHLIEGTIQSVANGGRITEETARELKVVADNVSQVAQLVQEISVASNAQADSIAQVTSGIEQISSVVQANSATAEETAATSEELSSQANDMNNMISHFKLHEDGYRS